MTKIKESEFYFQSINLYNRFINDNYTNNPVVFDANTPGFLFANNENLLSNVMIENPSQSKNELIFGINDIRDKDNLIYKHSKKFLGFNFLKRNESTNVDTLNYNSNEWTRFNSIFTNKLLTTRLSTSKCNVMFKTYWASVKRMNDLTGANATAINQYVSIQVPRDITNDHHYLFSLDSSYKNAGLLTVLNDSENNQKYILMTDTSSAHGLWDNMPKYNNQSLFVYKGDDLNIDTYQSSFSNNTINTGDILKNTFTSTNTIPNNQLTYLFTDFTNRAIYFLKTSQFKSTAASPAVYIYRNFSYTTILKATWTSNETILNAKFATNTLQNWENITTSANFQASSFGATGQLGALCDARYFTKYLGYLGQDFTGKNYFLYINEGITRDGSTNSTNVENVIDNLSSTIKNSWATKVFKEDPVTSTLTDVAAINYSYTSMPYEVANTARNIAITSTTSVALTKSKNNTFNLTNLNVIYYAPTGPITDDIFRIEHLGSVGSFKLQVSATNTTYLLGSATTAITAASNPRVFTFKYNGTNWVQMTDLGYFPIQGTHNWNEPRTGTVSTYLSVPSKVTVNPNNSNLHYFYSPAYTNTNFSYSKVTSSLSAYTPILYIWDKSLTSTAAISILDCNISYPVGNDWFSYSNTHTEGYNKGISTEYYFNFETNGKLRESHDNSQLYKFFHHNFITKVGNRYFLNHCIFYGTNYNADLLVDNSNSPINSLQKCRRIVSYEIDTSNWRNLTYHSYYEFDETQIGFLSLDEDNFTKILVNCKNSVKILDFDENNGWFLSANYSGNFVQITRDSNNNIWAVKCNINLQEKLYENLISNLVTNKVVFELHKLNETDTSSIINDGYKIEINEEKGDNIFYQSTIDNGINIMIKKLKVSIYDVNNTRIVSNLNLQIQGANGKVLFNDNGLDNISITTSQLDDTEVEIIITDSTHFYIVPSLDIII